MSPPHGLKLIRKRSRRCTDRPGLGVLRAGRHHELLHRPPPRARLPRSSHGPQVQDRREAAAPGRVVLPAPRRQDDPDRPVHRARARAVALRRRVVGPVLPPLPPVLGDRVRAVGDAVHGPGLRLLPVVRQGGGSRGEGDVRLRGHGRGDRGRGLRRAPPAQGGGSPAGWPTGSTARASGRWSARVQGPASALEPPRPPRMGAGGAAGQFIKERVDPGAAGTRADHARRRSPGSAHTWPSLYTMLITGGREITPADRELLDMADDLRRRHGGGHRQGGDRPRSVPHRRHARVRGVRGAGAQAPFHRAGGAAHRRAC